MKRIDIALKMKEQGLVPLFYHADIEVCKKVLQACYDGGARLLEFTNRGVFADTVFAELARYSQENLPGLYLGVGSITDAPTAALFIQNGADFIVTPAFRKDIALLCNRRKIMFIPGCGTLTEIGYAEELGCEVVKLFPGSTYGPNFIKSIKGPQPWTQIMPTGGVDLSEENLKSWFDAGALCVGMGSKLISKDVVEERNYSEISRKVRQALDTISRLRQI